MKKDDVKEAENALEAPFMTLASNKCIPVFESVCHLYLLIIQELAEDP